MYNKILISLALLLMISACAPGENTDGNISPAITDDTDGRQCRLRIPDSAGDQPGCHEGCATTHEGFNSLLPGIYCPTTAGQPVFCTGE